MNRSHPVGAPMLSVQNDPSRFDKRIVGLFVATALPRQIPVSERRASATNPTVRVVAALAVVAACLGPFATIVFVPGAPAFLHDWGVIPAPQASWEAWILDAVSPVRQYGAGQAAAGAPNFFMVVPMALALGAFGQRGACVLLALACAGVMACGIWSLTRSLRFGPLQSACFAIAYACSPALFNQIVAGHTSLIMVFTAAPLFLASLQRFCERRGSWAALGASAVLVSAQLQGLIVLAILALAFFATRGRGARMWPALAVVAASVGMCEASQYAAVVTPEFIRAFDGQRATIPWEMAQSAPVPSALASLGYLGGYDGLVTAQVPYLQPFLELTAIAAVGIALWRRQWLPVALAAAGATLASGLLGPLRPVLLWLFARFEWATVLREFYSFSSLTALGLALAIASAASHRWFALPALAGLVVFAITGATVSLRILPRYEIEPDMTRALATVYADRTPGRVLFLPFATPLGPAGTPGGNDPYYLGTTLHPSLNVLFPPYPDATIAYGLDELWEGDALAANALRAFDVNDVVVRKTWSSTFRARAPWLESRSGFSAASGEEWEARIRALAGARRVFASSDVDVFALPRGGDPSWLELPKAKSRSSIVPASDQRVDYRCDRPSCGLVSSALHFSEASQLAAFGAYPAITTAKCLEEPPGEYLRLSHGAWSEYRGGRVCGAAGQLQAVLRVERRAEAYVLPPALLASRIEPSIARWNVFGTEARVSPPGVAHRTLFLPLACSARWSAADAGGTLAPIASSFGCLWKSNGGGAVTIRYAGWQRDVLLDLVAVAAFFALAFVAIAQAVRTNASRGSARWQR